MILHSALITGLIGTLLSLLACVALRRRGRPRLLAALLGPAVSLVAQLVLGSLAIGIAVAPRGALDAMRFAHCATHARCGGVGLSCITNNSLFSSSS